jgi:hypothetical protein
MTTTPAVAADLRVKPCSRAYRGGGGRHARMILANRHGLDVRLYSQPQRAAFPSLSVPLWWGSVLVALAPAACLGVLQEAALPLIGALTPLRHAAEPRKPRAPRSRSLTSHASCTNRPVRCGSTWSHPTDLAGQPRICFVTLVMPNKDTRAVPRCPGSVRGASRRQGQAASRWPPASLDSSLRPADSAVSEGKPKIGHQVKMPRCLQILASSGFRVILSGYLAG